jgi:16S rRNA C967 or C1407 C5-methylase (RsmB/RsmF family)
MLKKSNLIQKFAGTLWTDSDKQSTFVDSLYQGKSVARRAIIELVPTTISPLPAEFWQPDFVKIPNEEFSPGKDPAHTAGDYYCLDCSSVFLMSALKTLKIAPKNILDLCASPGGKSVFSWKLFSPELIVSNETINARIPALISNLKRCHIRPAIVTCMDPEKFVANNSGAFELVLVDAPCSGQSMFPLGKQYSSAFHSSVINKNAMRQRRILSQAAKLVSSTGTLVYTTCTFSLDENEKLINWFLQNHPEYEATKIESYHAYQSEFTDTPCYRLFPSHGLGAGGFLTIFSCKDSGISIKPAPNELKIAWKND